MKLLLHPGHSKCGSTSIQEWVKRNLRALGKNGIAVPSSDCSLASSSRRARTTTYPYLRRCAESRDMTGFERDFRSLVEEASKRHSTLLWSDEFLTDPRVQDEPCRIHQIVSEHFESVRVVFYIRKQTDFLLAAWEQWNHKRGESLESMVRNSMANHQPDYLSNVRFLQHVYGRENVSLRYLGPETLTEGDLIRDFCTIGGIDSDRYTPLAERANVSLNPYLCEILSLSSKSIYANNCENLEVEQWLKKYAPKSGAFDPCREFMKPELRSQVLAGFESDNRTLHAEFFPEHVYSDLFGPEHPGVAFDEMEGMKKVLSVQFEMLFNITRSLEGQGSVFKNLLRRIRKFLPLQPGS